MTTTTTTTTTTQIQLIQQLTEALNSAKNLTIKPAKKVEREDCPYCLETIGDTDSVIQKCGHHCHLSCMMKDLFINKNITQLKCCLCRNPVISREERQELRQVREEAARQHIRAQENYERQLREQYATERLARNPVRLPTRVVRPVRTNNNLARHQRNTGNQNQQLVINALNTETHITIEQIVTNLNGVLGDGAVRRHIRNLVNTNRVHRGQSGGRASNYMLVANQERHE